MLNTSDRTRLTSIRRMPRARRKIKDGKEHKMLGSSSVRVLHRWNWTDVSVVVICYGLTVVEFCF